MRAISCRSSDQAWRRSRMKTKNASSPRRSASCAESAPTIDCSVASCNADRDCRMHASSRPSFELKYSYSIGLDTPTSSAISSIDAIA